jgi:NAD(P)-dependent dehydrogenase (short-subunit alcohol dehydrogenase family)
MVERALAEFGKIDILINNAGVGLRKPLLDLSDQEWSYIVRICLDGPFFVARAVAPHMIRQGFGRIINISSSLGGIALPERGPYCSAKGGLLQLTKVMALEWARDGITVNAICPGPFKTPYNMRLVENPELFESYLNLIPQHRWGELDEIRAAAVFLASREAAFVTGTALYVDGGWTAHGGLPMDGATDPAGTLRGFPETQGRS